MAITVTKEEVLKEIWERKNERIHFIFEEEINGCHITFCNQENEITFYGIVNQNMGLELVLNFFQKEENFQLEPHVDTIKVTKENRPIAFIRHKNNGYVVKEQDHIVEQLLLALLEIMNNELNGAEVIRKENGITFDSSFRSFTVLNTLENKERMKYLITEYLKSHPNIHPTEEKTSYRAGNITFIKQGLGLKKTGEDGSSILSRYCEQEQSSLIWSIFQEVKEQEQRKLLTKKEG